MPRTKEQQQEYDRQWYRRNKERKRQQYYFRRYGIKLQQRNLPLELPELKLITWKGIEIVAASGACESAELAATT